MSSTIAPPPNDDSSSAARHTLMRSQNQTLLLKILRREGPLTKAQLAARTGLAKSGITNIIEDLFRTGLIEETEAISDNSRGRPGNPLDISDAGPVGLGIEINVDYISVVVSTMRGDVVHSCISSLSLTNPHPQITFSLTAPLVAECVAAARNAGFTIAGAVMSVPGTVTPNSLQVRNAPNLNWHDVDLGPLLVNLLAPYDLPLAPRLENEANSGALAERWFGEGIDHDNFVFISGEMGIGAGIVMDGAIFRGPQGLAGEFGHVISSPNGPLCACGSTGCLERFAGLHALLKGAGHPLRAPNPIELLSAPTEANHNSLKVAARHLGIAMASLNSILDPRALILGGTFAALSEQMLPTLMATLAQYAPGAAFLPDGVLVSKLGRLAAARGAAGMVCESIFENPGRYVSTVQVSAGV